MSLVATMRQGLSAAGDRLTWAMLAVGGVLIAGSMVTGAQAYAAAASTVALITTVVALLVRPAAHAAAWWSLAVCVAASVSAQLSSVTGSQTPDVGIGYGRAALFYATLLLGLFLLPARSREADLAESLDSTIVTLGAFLLVWVLLLAGQLPSTGAELLFTAFRTVGLAVGTGALARLLFVVGRPPKALRLAIAGVVAGLCGSALLLAVSNGYPVPPLITDNGIAFAVFAVLLAAGALHPSVRQPVLRRETTSYGLSRNRIIVFVGLTLIGPLAWVIAVLPGPFNPASVRSFGLPVIGAALISVLLVWRLSLMARVADRRADDLASANLDLERLQAELSYQATHDPLTGLANRSVLSRRLDALAAPNGGGRRDALLMLDLDDFKDIKDTLGHLVGDELLADVGRRLASLAPPASTVVRLGGDEFAILLMDTDEQEVRGFAERVRASLCAPYYTTLGMVSVSASIGVRARPDGGSQSDVMREADLALYEAKATGGNKVSLYDPRLRRERPA